MNRESRMVCSMIGALQICFLCSQESEAMSKNFILQVDGEQIAGVVASKDPCSTKLG